MQGQKDGEEKPRETKEDRENDKSEYRREATKPQMKWIKKNHRGMDMGFGHREWIW